MNPTAQTSTPSPVPAPPVQVSPTQSDDDDQHEQATKQDAAKGSLKLEDALAFYKDAVTYRNAYRGDWDKYFKVYKGVRTNRNYQGVSDISVRETHTIVETLVANIAGGDIKFHFMQLNEEQARDTEVINEMLDYWAICNSLTLINQEWVREMIQYGTATVGVEWREGKPFIFNIPLRDFFVDPTSTGLVRTITPARYAGYEYLADRKELEREQVYDAEEKKWVPRYKNLNKLTPRKGTSTNGKKDATDKEFKDMFAHSTLGEKATENQIHVIKMYYLPTGEMIEIGNKKEIIYQDQSWAQRKEKTRTIQIQVEDQVVDSKQTLDEIKPFLPFAVLRDYIDTSQFYGAGEIELLIEDAEQLNDYESMQMDNSAYQNTPMYWVDPAFADLIPEIDTIPGAVYPIPRNAMGTLERPQLSTDLDNKSDRILGRMRRATAADEAVQGVSQSSSRTTATEVNTQLQQSQTRFSTKIQNLESEGFAQLGALIFKCAQIFITKKTAIRIAGKNGVYFKNFDPWEYNGEYEAHAVLDSTIKKNQVEVGLKDQAVYEALSKVPGINPVELGRWWVQLKDPDMDDEKFNSFMLPPEAPQPSEAEVKSEADIKKTVLTIMGQIFKDSGPYVRMEIQEQLGLSPDPQLEGDAQNRMLEQANQGADHMDAATRADGTIVPGLEDIQNSPTPAPQPAGMTA